MMFGLPSVVSCVCRPVAMSPTQRLFPFTYATLRLSGENLANICSSGSFTRSIT